MDSFNKILEAPYALEKKTIKSFWETVKQRSESHLEITSKTATQRCTALIAVPLKHVKKVSTTMK
jgi:hypothetical protein